MCVFTVRSLLSANTRVSRLPHLTEHCVVCACESRLQLRYTRIHHGRNLLLPPVAMSNPLDKTHGAAVTAFVHSGKRNLVGANVFIAMNRSFGIPELSDGERRTNQHRDIRHRL